MPCFIHRYGLKHLAVEALSDLLASACHHAAASQPALWFGRFCGVARAADMAAAGSNNSNSHSSSSSRQHSGVAEISSPAEQPGADQVHPEGTAEAAGTAALTDGRQQGQPQRRQADDSSSATGSGAEPAAVAAAVATAVADMDVELLLSSSAALDFYIFCCCQLAYPNSIVALFPEGENAQPLVRSSLVMESLKAVFR